MKIVFVNENDGVSIVTPVESALQELGIHRIGEISVPRGVPFWVVEDSFIPEDRTYRDAWELDIATLPVADGYGEADD